MTKLVFDDPRVINAFGKIRTRGRDEPFRWKGQLCYSINKSLFILAIYNSYYIITHNIMQSSEESKQADENFIRHDEKWLLFSTWRSIS